MKEKTYIGVKLIKAEPMTRGEYNKKRGWTIPKDENPKDEGYVVQYDNGYVSWSPKDVFEKAYSEVEPGFTKVDITYNAHNQEFFLVVSK